MITPRSTQDERAAFRLGALVATAMLVAACGGPTPPKAPGSAPESASAAASVSSAPVPPAPIVLDTSGLANGTSGTSATSATSAGARDGGAEAGSVAEKPTRITARHVLIQYMGAQSAHSSIVRTKEQAFEVAQEVLKRAKSGEDFARLAVEFSDEPNAGARGGSLGRFGHGQMVHEFEDAAFALSVGQLSGIVETPFGFHVIQRTE
jgi:NIMA-interacting peptidyl-prolyl cis-trans isomerase 1